MNNEEFNLVLKECPGWISDMIKYNGERGRNHTEIVFELARASLTVLNKLMNGNDDDK